MSPTSAKIKIDQIIRSRRKTLSLEVTKEGRIVIRAPYLIPRSQIDSFVRSKEGWIRKKQELVAVQSRETPAKKYVIGEKFWYLGCEYMLELVNGQEEPLFFRDKFYLEGKFQKEGQLVFENWYKKRAADKIVPIVNFRALQNGFSFTRIRITSAKTRWGSCGIKGSLNFTWRLVMAPLEVIDYVVVHELVHLNIKNHSREYWNEVSKVMPEFKQHKKWLKENGHRLTLD
jgi:predicted metal-dependent hydrolase